MESPIKSCAESSPPHPANAGSPPAITLVLAHLGLGGAERVMSMLANHWAGKGWRVTLMTLGYNEGRIFFPLDHRVRHIDFGWEQEERLGLPKLRKLRATWKLRRALLGTNPDCVLSFLNTTNVKVLMAAWGTGTPVVVSERTDPWSAPLDWFWSLGRRVLYPTAACVITQTQRAASFFTKRVQARGRVIPNPVFLPAGFSAGAGPRGATEPPEILGMGRLSREKGFDILIEAFARVQDTYPEWRLTIWGEGADRSRLEQLVSDLRLGHKIRLPGATTSPFEQFFKASLFVLPSRYEGFPNALCEAMACGLPVVSSRWAGEGDAIVRHEFDGLVVPCEDPVAMAEAMGRLMGDEGLRARLGSQAARAAEVFGFDRIMGQWEEVILAASSGRGPGPLP